ncbi:MAG: indolepyruvate oxidoreductase subunit beta [Chloroflexi bacterium]|nr:indolepyruvate oxidoreductase subunit beta [Chloroflexota bacterium]
MPKTDFIIAGVGGQGVILASDLLGDLAIATGRDVKKADVIGMAQRGGEVVSHVRWGDKVYSPLVQKGGAEYLLGLEKLESARWAPYLAPSGLAIVNNQSILPITVSSGGASYPPDEALVGTLRARTERVFVIEGQELARDCGAAAATNMVLMGYLARFLHLEQALWLDAIAQRVPKRFLEPDQRAFLAGWQEAEKAGAHP